MAEMEVRGAAYKDRMPDSGSTALTGPCRRSERWLTCPGRVVLVESPEDGADHERGGARGALLARDVGLLRHARGHVVHDGHDDADGLLGHRHPLGQLELWGEWQ